MPGKSHGQRSLAGCSLWGHEESDTTKRLHFTKVEIADVSSLKKAPQLNMFENRKPKQMMLLFDHEILDGGRKCF